MTTKRLLINHPLIEQRGISLPWQVKAHKPFRLLPEDFMAGTKYLKPKLIEAEVQLKSYEAFAEKPAQPCLYGVGSEPDDTKAKAFAAHLLTRYLQATPNSFPGWLNLHDRRDPLKDPEPYTFLVVSSITPESTPYRVERLRDVLEHYTNIPCVVVVSGTDPVTFFAERLHLKLSHLFFATSQSVEHTTQIV